MIKLQFVWLRNYENINTYLNTPNNPFASDMYTYTKWKPNNSNLENVWGFFFF